VTEAEPEGGPARVFGATVRHPARRSEASRA
jgi:hypothetical protein